MPLDKPTKGVQVIREGFGEAFDLAGLSEILDLPDELQFQALLALMDSERKAKGLAAMQFPGVPVDTTTEGRPVFLNPIGSLSSEITTTFGDPGGESMTVPTILAGMAVDPKVALRVAELAGGIDPDTGRPLAADAMTLDPVGRSRTIGFTGRVPNQTTLRQNETAALIARALESFR